MKNVAKFIALAVIVLVAVGLVACNPTVDDLTKVYKNYTSKGEFTGYEVAIASVPDGWSLYSPDYGSVGYKNSDSGYVKDLDAFVLKKEVQGNDYLTLMKCGSDAPMFNEGHTITSLRVRKGMIVCKCSNGDVFITDYNGKVLVNRGANGAVGLISGTGSQSIDSVVKVLDTDLFAVNPKYDSNASNDKSHTNIYRKNGTLDSKIRNSGADVSKISAFDNEYLVVAVTVEDGTDTSRIFKLEGDGKVLGGKEYGTYRDNGNTDYYCEITYIGEGKFLVHEDWKGTKDDYTYSYNDSLMKVQRFVYDADTNSRTAYNSDVYFLNLANGYYDESRNGISAASFLQDGYFYASYCISVDQDKKGYYDQFILDKDLNIVYSLSGNFGISIQSKDKIDSVSYFDLAMVFTDGIGVVPLPASSLHIFDVKGNLLNNSTKSLITTAAYNNGTIIAGTLNSKSETLYAIFDVEGNELTAYVDGENKEQSGFRFDSIDPFLGYYTTAVLNGDLVLLSRDGEVVNYLADNTTKPFSDIASTGGRNPRPIYKLGCYAFKVPVEDSKNDKGEYAAYNYGVKNLRTDDSAVIIPATLTSITLYSPTSSPADVFVLGRVGADNPLVIYRLI